MPAVICRAREGEVLEAMRRCRRVAALAAWAALAIAPAGAWGTTKIAGCSSALPVVAHRAGAVLVRLPRGGRKPTACARETGYATSESSIAVTSDGALVYSPAETENSMARSLDGGAMWSLTYPAIEQHTSFWNTTDPYVIADRRTGRVFWSHATGPVRNEGELPDESGFYLAAAYGFQVYSSSNDPQTLTTAAYSTA